MARYTPMQGLDIGIVVCADRFQVDIDLLSSSPLSSTLSITSIGSLQVPNMDEGVEAESHVAGHRWGSL